MEKGRQKREQGGKDSLRRTTSDEKSNLQSRLKEDVGFRRRTTIAMGGILAALVVVLVMVVLIPAGGVENGTHRYAGNMENVSAGDESGIAASNAAASGTSAITEEDTIAPDSVLISSSLSMVESVGAFVSGNVYDIGQRAAATASEPYRDKPDIDITSWEYILANPWNDIGDYTPELAYLEGQQFDVRIVDAMKAFAQGARDEGLTVVLSSGYRSYDTQTYLFNRKVAQYGEEVAATIVARPGTSEHQTGLCCDITDRYYEMKDESLENTALYQWMSGHCQEYGFIVRFPKGKEEITGIIYEPWHFRYVGVEAATYITENDLTLEEFLDLYK